MAYTKLWVIFSLIISLPACFTSRSGGAGESHELTSSFSLPDSDSWKDCDKLTNTVNISPEIRCEYLKYVKMRLIQHLTTEENEVEFSRNGNITFSFKLAKDGNIDELDVKFKEYIARITPQYIEEAIQQTSPLKPLPKESHLDSITITGELWYYW